MVNINLQQSESSAGSTASHTVSGTGLSTRISLNGGSDTLKWSSHFGIYDYHWAHEVKIMHKFKSVEKVSTINKRKLF